jgi:hypothetical protein
MDISFKLARFMVFTLGLCRLDYVSGLYVNVGRFWIWRVVGARWEDVIGGMGYGLIMGRIEVTD